MAKLTTPAGEKLTSLPASQIRQAAAATNAAAKSAVITPSQCRELTLKASSVPEDAGLAVGQGSGKKLTVSVVLSEAKADLAARVSGASKLLSTCAKVTLKSGGNTTQQSLSKIQATPIGDSSVMALNKQAVSGVSVTIVQLSAVKGDRLVTLSLVGNPTPAVVDGLTAMGKKALEIPVSSAGSTA